MIIKWRFWGRRCNHLAASLIVITLFSSTETAPSSTYYPPITRPSTSRITPRFQHTYVMKEPKFLLPLDSPKLRKRYNCSGCPNVYLPVCSSNNETYINFCFFACKNELAFSQNLTRVVRRGICMSF